MTLRNFTQYEYENGIIYLGDCMKVLPLLESESVDLVFTDPPFNISQKGVGITLYENRKPRKDKIVKDFGEWDYNFDIIPFLTESKRILNKHGSVIVWTSDRLFGKYYDWFQKEMYPKQSLVWVKNNPLPIFKANGYRRASELLLWATKNKSIGKNPNFIFLGQKEMKSVFYAPLVQGKQRTKHPTQKPLSITREIIKRHCRVSGIVLDPFMGSGTTGVACAELNRRFIGIEIEPKYFEIAKKRIKDTTQQKYLFHTGKEV